MRNRNKRTQKGFTLIELIIVMAIVSILLLGVMKVSQPAIKIMNNTSNAEKTYGYTDNIRTYLQAQLEYADALWVIPENELDVHEFESVRHPAQYDEFGNKIAGTETIVRVGDGGSIEDAVEDFVDENYFGVVSYNGSGSTNILDQIQPMKGKVNVLRLCNHDHGSFRAGQITLTTYDFESYNNTSDYFASSGIDITNIGAETPAINEAYFNAYDTDDYTFSYTLGAYDLIGDDSISGPNPTDSFKVVAQDRDNVGYRLNGINDLAVSIVLGTGITVDLPGSTGSFRAFQNPSQISVANIPLVNISYRAGNAIGRMYVNNEYIDPITTLNVPQLIKWGDESVAAHPVGTKSYIKAFYSFPWSVDSSAEREIDFTEDIFFIYSYATDLE